MGFMASPELIESARSTGDLEVASIAVEWNAMVLLGRMTLLKLHTLLPIPALILVNRYLIFPGVAAALVSSNRCTACRITGNLSMHAPLTSGRAEIHGTSPEAEIAVSVCRNRPLVAVDSPTPIEVTKDPAPELPSKTDKEEAEVASAVAHSLE